ncbi:winged helix-turn-helix transcriptional regulator [Lentzea sp. PSKA42]|uniref:Winged helix-turn-helix transcriptional regulator n=1 Tax=Lentzea indica TaxID=2604800 RepID=A0ABX1FLD4_9PSEU|nr:winged helix-turn-helix domain-containing protein [Lentzea indica]NKE59401.1 winged helix-turn-helix transcriptional regulator [Lentzea indica]
MGKLDPNDSRAPFLQVADRIADAIGSGEYAPGDQLPSLNELGERYGVAVGTVRSALNVLRDKGMTVTRPGSGSFVRSDLTIGGSLSHSRSSELGEVLQLLHEINGRLADIERRLPGE